MCSRLQATDQCAPVRRSQISRFSTDLLRKDSAPTAKARRSLGQEWAHSLSHQEPRSQVVDSKSVDTITSRILLIGPSASALIATTSLVGAAFPVRKQIHDRHARRQHAAILASFPSVPDSPLWPTALGSSSCTQRLTPPCLVHDVLCVKMPLDSKTKSEPKEGRSKLTAELGRSTEPVVE